MKTIAWNEIPHDNLIQGIRRQIVTGDKVMLGRLYFPKGAQVPAHRHESEQITHVLKGALRFIVDGTEVVVREGQLLHIPSNVEHSAKALEETDEIDSFSPIRADWLNGEDSYLKVSPRAR